MSYHLCVVLWRERCTSGQAGVDDWWWQLDLSRHSVGTRLDDHAFRTRWSHRHRRPTAHCTTSDLTHTHTHQPTCCTERFILVPYTDALATLHWLQILEHVQHKVAMLTYKVLHDSAPQYLGPLVTVADLPGLWALRSASTSQLVVPPIKMSTVGSRAFPVAAGQVWNSIPEAVVSSLSLQTFCHHLKTHFFQMSYPHLIVDC